MSERDSTDKKLTEIFNAIGLAPNLYGTLYLREAVKLEVEKSLKIKTSMKELYPKIAESCLTTPDKVERAIRHAISSAWNRGKIENFNLIFGKNVYNKNVKPTNSELIGLLVNKIVY